ncbi:MULTISPECIES: hypothetical protein [unclassified Microbulbifer]|uniref:Glycine zipper family protein n=1 Tax=Microbulbifer spongiae TaxID=2944933 RepID=A0ABY9EH09_9GAMM|nr:MULTISPECIES: hypothetical protein [unclassified Microbulbifer]MDP5210236.1 hypothetical protein [Microbulbifer sp. 2205BS26-8]MDP5211201.1 hypothetical protein [Microbulbifer sp. 2205BS26-8]WKD51049.1 hypothetical protein M8T91_06405 [Microbulbifer sp. MI-G]
MNKSYKRKIIFWSIFFGVVGLLVGDKGGGGYEKIIWAACGASLGAFIGLLFYKSQIKKEVKK